MISQNTSENTLERLEEIKVKCIYGKQIGYPLLRLELVYDMVSYQHIHQVNIPSSHLVVFVFTISLIIWE